MEADIIIEGNLGQSVEWREHPVYGGRATFSVAVTPGYRRGEEWVDLNTMWFRVTCWRQMAVHVRDSLGKGDAVVVKGKLRLDKWTDEHGNERQEFSIKADWVAPNLRRGKATFERTRLRPEPDEPTYLTDAESARLAAIEAQYAALSSAGVREHIDADGVVHEDAEAETTEPASEPAAV
ncbi:MAG: single-stranded DNA-binding protein [Propionibacteriaceae bacterium]|nr:single-stranded DNA-binding protein [Propionibacteriaceae bacterium]